MRDFLSRLSARVLNTAPVVEPLLAPRFADADDAPELGGEADAVRPRAAAFDDERADDGHPAVSAPMGDARASRERAADEGRPVRDDVSLLVPRSVRRAPAAAAARIDEIAEERDGSASAASAVTAAPTGSRASARWMAADASARIPRATESATSAASTSTAARASGSTASLDRTPSSASPGSAASTGSIRSTGSADSRRTTGSTGSMDGTRSAGSMRAMESSGSQARRSAGWVESIESVESVEPIEATAVRGGSGAADGARGSSNPIASRGARRSGEAAGPGASALTRRADAAGVMRTADGGVSASPPAMGSADARVEVHEEIVSAPSATGRASRGDARQASASRPSADIATGAEGARGLLVPTHRPRRTGRGEEAVAAEKVESRRADAQAEAAPPAIRVRVGRVEIRAAEPAAKPRRRAGEGPRGAWTPPVLSLDGYLRPGGER